jgi:hypothetical protein
MFLKMRILRLACGYLPSLTNRIVSNPQKIKTKRQFLKQRISTVLTEQLTNKSYFQKCNNMLASAFSTAYRVGSQLLGIKQLNLK